MSFVNYHFRKLKLWGEAEDYCNREREGGEEVWNDLNDAPGHPASQKPKMECMGSGLAF